MAVPLRGLLSGALRQGEQAYRSAIGAQPKTPIGRASLRFAAGLPTNTPGVLGQALTQRPLTTSAKLLASPQLPGLHRPNSTHTPMADPRPLDRTRQALGQGIRYGNLGLSAVGLGLGAYGAAVHGPQQLVNALPPSPAIEAWIRDPGRLFSGPNEPGFDRTADRLKTVDEKHRARSPLVAAARRQAPALLGNSAVVALGLRRDPTYLSQLVGETVVANQRDSYAQFRKKNPLWTAAGNALGLSSPLGVVRNGLLGWWGSPPSPETTHRDLLTRYALPASLAASSPAYRARSPVGGALQAVLSAYPPTFAGRERDFFSVLAQDAVEKRLPAPLTTP